MQCRRDARAERPVDVATGRQQCRHEHEQSGDGAKLRAHAPEDDAREQAADDARRQRREAFPVGVDGDLADCHCRRGWPPE